MAAADSASSFDYVIVGAGAAGCLLADRLSADGNQRVARIEPRYLSDAAGSDMATITRGHTYAPTLLIAERAADILRGL